jgi:hypothetical protein
MKTKQSSEIPYRNRSPFGWWIASYIEQAIWDDVINPSPNSRCRAWENTIILQAPNREAAYKKAIKLGSSSPSTFDDGKGRSGHWKFIGLTSLLPIYDELKDGAEITWIDHGNRTVGKIRSLIKDKSSLEAFNDEKLVID